MDTGGRVVCALALAATIGCGGGDDPEPMGPGPDDREAELVEIDTYLGNLAPLVAEPEARVEGEPSAPEREGDYSCTTRDLSETRQYDRVVAYGLNSESMWPGALLRGDSVYSGEFVQVVTDRAPLTVSVSLENLAGQRSATIEAPSLSSFRDAIGDILAADVTGDTAANIYSEIEQVHSEQQLGLALGAGVSTLGSAAQIRASFSFNDQQKRSRYLVKYIQSYYTVDIDQPSAPSAVFAPSVTPDDVRAHFGTDNPPVYVSSVTYGRMVVFTFESSYSGLELGSALEFAYKGGADVSGDVSVTYRDIVDQADITAYILGGSGGDAARSIDSYEGLIEFIKNGGNYSRSSPGAPIAYKLAYLADNAPARLSYAEEYQQRECVRVSQKLAVTLDSVTCEDAGDDGDDTCELYGLITATATGEVTLFDRDTSSLLTVAEGETLTLGTETILEVTPQPGNQVDFDYALVEDDVFDDDELPLERFTASYETGWRRTKDMLLIAGNTRVKVTISLRPI
ncbi:MAG: hypothetical protein Tsb0020_45630 [Haliangiales bacterium]